ncbi:unnamed protein product [Penicillium olsonii]|nr:unnamed protein product [Penicillium olsonii]
MPKVSLEKVHKQISKKRGVLNIMHENSRDAHRLRKAGARVDRLSRHNHTVNRARQPYMDRIEYIHEAVQEHTEALTTEQMTEFVAQYIDRDTEEIQQLQSERRKGRPPSKREEALKERVQTEDREFTTGLWMPDLSDQYALTGMKNWNGHWSGLSAIKFIRFTKDGEKLASTFPPKSMPPSPPTLLSLPPASSRPPPPKVRYIHPKRTYPCTSDPRHCGYSIWSLADLSISSTGDVELLAKLEDELKHEKSSDIPEFKEQQEVIQEIIKANEWQVKDVEGEQEVVLSKKFGNEKISVSFTVADIQNISEQEDFDEASLSDDMGYQNKDGQEEGELPEPSFPARVNVTIEKPTNGAVLIQAVVQDGVFAIEEVSHFAKADLAAAQTAEKDWTRQSLYAGPPFENLDEDLQSLWERYIEDRGINAELATMIPDYISVKEQKEYLRWLENVKNFVGA